MRVGNFERNQSLNQDVSVELYRTHQIDILAHGEFMRPELLQYAEFTSHIFAIR